MGNLTVGELKKRLSVYKDSAKISFAGGLTFYQLKTWSDNELFVEFNEPEGYLSDEFRKRNPGVKVVFIDPTGANCSASGIIGDVDVSVR
ncbi:hypothetical protein DSCW_17920 [Desulfosarcina widdelii]|uniref:Uncharacterized protein n=1 Tax=Desulfosarcina widdelii TaxID=947919 RepID=A0A5K7Z104_9BACT|nr:hypothetical protein [Desulfosarcina widdelii]BBO74375.1 hypothetical protein DSCW_17920 [Desulfosarcina widdelii]